MAKKKSSAKKGQDIELLNSGYYASATYYNDVPADWGVTIIEVACKFIDDDGNNDNKSASVNIKGGGNSYTLNSTYQGCCRQYVVLMKVRDRGNEETYANAATVESGYCGGNLKWHLVPQTKIISGSAIGDRPLALVSFDT